MLIFIGTRPAKFIFHIVLLLLLTLGVAAIGPALAQENDPLSFSVPAQSLGSALLEFADQAGLDVLFDAAIVEGLSSGGVNDNLTPDQALIQLLKGTGLKHRFVSPTSVSVERDVSQANEETMQLGTMELQPIFVEGEVGVVTEDTKSYTTPRATVGSRLPTDIREVPQAITVVTSERLEDSNAKSIEEAAYLIPNIHTATGDLFVGSLYSRGHELFTYNVDGAPRPFLSIYGTAPDLVFFDRMEILSGPSGVFQGSGESVGTLNLVRKRPKDETAASAAFAYGTFNSYRGEADLSTPLLEDKSLRMRIVGFGETEESFVDITEQDRLGAYGTIEYDFTENTTLAIGTIIEDQEMVRFTGLPTFSDGGLIDLDRDTFIGAPFNDFDARNYEGFADLEHRFDSGSVLRIVGRYFTRDVEQKTVLGLSAVDRATGEFDLFTFARDFDEEVGFADINYTKHFEVFQREVALTVGTDWRYIKQTTLQNFDFSAGTQNIFDFDPSIIPEADIEFPGVGPGFRLNTETTANEFGGYAQGRIYLTDRLAFTGGARITHFDSETEDTGRGIETSDINETEFVPFVGLGYDVTDEVTLYSSYSEIFQAQTELDGGGAQLDPVIGRQVEFGSKAAFLDGMLSAQIAGYYLRDENRAEEDPDNIGSFIEGDSRDTYGFEATLAGRPYKGVDITLGYSYVDTDLDTDPTPPHSATAFGRYTFESGPLEGFFFGLGARGVTGFDSNSGDISIDAPGYVILDGTLGYQINENFKAQAYVENILDREYIDRVNVTSRGNFFGEPINAVLRLSASF
jgi:outer membrane receptor for ferric coprogen and ferric-rhodotorulic acid